MIYPSDPDVETEVVLQADKSAFKAEKGRRSRHHHDLPNGTKKRQKSRQPRCQHYRPGQPDEEKETDADQIDFNKKILHMSWHPFEDSIAIAATNNLFVFSAL
ncbi:hypothetical protein ABVK25_012404 [Lepraria finkii]|uniref:Uncharacterized protein n=1 Tax=Lepraria finkii TaxID=1340010 RepID=A0ABR4AIJ4_9LECA